MVLRPGAGVLSKSLYILVASSSWGDLIMADKQPIGKITHFFSKISVAVIELKEGLKVGDTIEIVTSEGPFQQKVESMQIDGKDVKESNASDAIGIKLSQDIEVNSRVYLE